MQAVDIDAPKEPLYAIEPRGEREMMLYTAAFLWAATWIGVLVASLIAPELGPNADVIWTWRITLIPIVLVAIFSHLTWMKRLDDVRVYQVAIFFCLVNAGMELAVMLNNGLSSGAVFLALLASAVFAAEFFSPRQALVQVALLSAVAMIPVLVHFEQTQEQHLLSRMAALLPIMWAVAFAMYALHRTRVEATSETETYSMSDPLTGLANLRALRKKADELLSDRNSRIAGATGILLIDLDDFKSANTLHGHVGGDFVLRTIANGLQRAASKTHTVARIGGDEFAVLIEDVDERDLPNLAIRYRNAVLSVREEAAVAGIMVDASVGSAITTQHGRTLEDLMTAADRSMYAAKADHIEHAPPPLGPELSPDLPVEFRAPRPELNWIWPDTEKAETKPKRSLRWNDRPKHARFAALTWSMGVTVMLLALAMPDADHTHLVATLIALGIGYVAAIVAYASTPIADSWHHVSGDVFTLAGIAIIAYLTGGSDSPAWPLVCLLIVYDAWFLDVEQIWFRLVGPVVVILLPLVYETPSEIGSSVGGALYAGSLLAVGLTIVMSYNQFYLARARRRTRRLATIDPLTGLWNRREFERRVQQELDGLSYRAMDVLAIVMIDLDDFKDVNTLHGHAAGDELLANIGEALGASARADDCVARVGGDEFAVVLPGVDAETAQLLARRFLEAVAEETAKADLPACRAVSASAGFALYGMHGRSLDELVNAADVALMSVKTSGKGVERVSSFVVSL